MTDAAQNSTGPTFPCNCPFQEFHTLISWIADLAKGYGLPVGDFVKAPVPFVQMLQQEEFLDQPLCLDLLNLAQAHESLSRSYNRDTEKLDELNTAVQALFRAVSLVIVLDDDEDNDTQ
jgi:hypothetical protein